LKGRISSTSMEVEEIFPFNPWDKENKLKEGS
jgi:hypothetical protein